MAAAAATQLVVTGQPMLVIAGTSYSLTVAAEDPFGNVDTTFTAPVTAAGIYVSPGAVAGVATIPVVAPTTTGTTALSLSALTASLVHLTGEHGPDRGDGRFGHATGRDPGRPPR